MAKKAATKALGYWDERITRPLTAKEQARDKQVEGLVKLMQFMAWKNLTKKDMPPPPHEEVEDIVQNALIKFLLKVRTGTIRNPKGYLYYFIRGFCADALEDFIKKRHRLGASLSFEFGGDDENDGCGLTLLDLVFDPWDDPAMLLEHGSRQDYEDRQVQIIEQQRAALGAVLDEVLDNDSAGDLWRHKATGKTYAMIAAAVDLTVDQVRGRMTRSKPRLRKRLRKLGYNGRGKINRAGGGISGTNILIPNKSILGTRLSRPLSGREQTTTDEELNHDRNRKGKQCLLVLNEHHAPT